MPGGDTDLCCKDPEARQYRWLERKISVDLYKLAILVNLNCEIHEETGTEQECQLGRGAERHDLTMLVLSMHISLKTHVILRDA